MKNYFYISDPASGGMNSKDEARELKDNESPFILNMNIQNKGRVICRNGYELWGEIAGQTGGFRGLHPFYRTYGANSGEYLLSFHSNANGYYSTAASPTPVSISTYGTDSGSVRGITFNNLAIIGNGLAANTIQKWAGTGNLGACGGTPPDTKIFGQVNHSLFGVDTASPTLIMWSDIDDPEDWTTGIGSNTTVGLGDGQDITWVGTVNDQPIVFKERSKWPIEITFDTNDVCVRFSVQEKKDSSGGCIATGSVQSMVNGQGETLYYLSEDGFQAYGALANFPSPNNPFELSYKINPTIKRINFLYTDLINSEKYDKKYICLVPYEHSQTNDYAFVYMTEFGSWTMWNGMMFADLKRFRDENGRDMLIAASNNEAKLYKFNTTFSDNGFGYERIFQSKTFTFGQRIKWEWLDIVGSKTQGSTIYVEIDVDGRTEIYKIDDDNFVRGSSGGLIGDNWVGNSYLGNGSPGETIPLYDFKARIAIKNIQYGHEFKFKIYNNADGEGWSMRGYGYKIAGLNDEIATTPNTSGYAYAKPYF